MADGITDLVPDELDRMLAGQRRINIIWEVSQSVIAILITLAVIYNGSRNADSPQLTNAFFLVVGFYFSRTNHANVGGVGPKIPLGPYLGR